MLKNECTLSQGNRAAVAGTEMWKVPLAFCSCFSQGVQPPGETWQNEVFEVGIVVHNPPCRIDVRGAFGRAVQRAGVSPCPFDTWADSMPSPPWRQESLHSSCRGKHPAININPHRWSPRYYVFHGWQRVVIQDLVRGQVSWDAESTVGDFILLRSTGVPVYNFCVAGECFLPSPDAG